MTVFLFEDYKKYILSRVKSMPQKGRGQHKKLAAQLRINPSVLSQVLRGGRELNLDQACELGRLFGLDDRETEYFVNLVELNHAQSPRLRTLIRKRLDRLRSPSAAGPAIHPATEATRGADGKAHGGGPTEIPALRGLSESEQGTFYSSWYYSGIRLATFQGQLRDLDTLAARFDLPRELVRKVIEFLVGAGLLRLDDEGKLAPGVARTQLGQDSPLIARHHQNWRLKAIERMPRSSADEGFYTSPMSVTHADAAWTKEMLMKTLRAIEERVHKSQGEKLSCLNVDWFDF